MHFPFDNTDNKPFLRSHIYKASLLFFLMHIAATFIPSKSNHVFRILKRNLQRAWCFDPWGKRSKNL